MMVLLAALIALSLPIVSSAPLIGPRHAAALFHAPAASSSHLSASLARVPAASSHLSASLAHVPAASSHLGLAWSVPPAVRVGPPFVSAAGPRVVPAVPARPVTTWRWPLAGAPTVVRGFAPPPRPWLPGHRGVDLGASDGAIVMAAGPGVIRFAGFVVSRPVVSIVHANGLITTYEPVTPAVAIGQTVTAGQAIGMLVSGHAGTCLHWGLRHGEAYLDPLALLGSGRVRLLALTD